jgi:glycosyltransferase involved in cell wall biosynthesis
LGSLLGDSLMRMAALAPFPFHFGQFGGAERIANLLTRVEHEIDVFVPASTVGDPLRLANLTIYGKQLPEWVTQSDRYDTALSEVAKEMFSDAVDPYDLIILEHPWQVEAVEGKRFIYDAHNNETKMKEQLSPQEVHRTNYLENKALKAEHVTYCSTADNLQTQSPTTLIPNGTDLPDIKRVNGNKIKNLLFVGSAHPPNIAAAVMLARMAQALPDYTIVIAGECSNYIENPPSNVRLTGHVNQTVLDFLFSNTHAFINLITAGSGTSLKIARALSYGVPVISSPLGARGYESACIIANNAQEVVNALGMLNDSKAYKGYSEAARSSAQELSWDNVGKKFNDVIARLL